MTQSYDELIELIAQLNARVSALEARMDQQSMAANAGRGSSTPSFHQDTFNRLTENMTMPRNALAQLVNGVGDRDVQVIAREDRGQRAVPKPLK
jgi:hypothetical protein